MSAYWTTALCRSPHGEAVFDVLAARQDAVLAWARQQDVPAVRHNPVHAPAVEAWAILDGGVTSLFGYGATTLAPGVRVVGYRAMRLLLADLDLAGPVTLFDGEREASLEELRHAHRSAAHDAAAVEQAELLATCHDAVMLRWVAATLRGAGQAASARAGPAARRKAL